MIKASKCPKCNSDPQVVVAMDHETGRWRACTFCPQCENSSPDGKDFLKEIAINKGIEEWEKMLKTKSYLQG